MVLTFQSKNIINLNCKRYLTVNQSFAKKCNTRTVHIAYIAFICCPWQIKILPINSFNFFWKSMICPYYYDYLAALISSHSSQPSCQVFDFAWAELESGCKVYASPLSFRSSPQLQPGEDTNVPACLSARHNKMKWNWNWTFCSKLNVSYLSTGPPPRLHSEGPATSRNDKRFCSLASEHAVWQSRWHES